jgi:hypothetical protein
MGAAASSLISVIMMFVQVYGRNVMLMAVAGGGPFLISPHPPTIKMIITGPDLTTTSGVVLLT